VPHFEVKIVGVSKAIKTSQSLTVPLNAGGFVNCRTLVAGAEENSRLPVWGAHAFLT
jgi:hypothetical protein